MAITAASLYGVSSPASKLLLEKLSPTIMASMLYLGAGIGMLALQIIKKISKAQSYEASLTKKELPYIIGMIILDIAAPIFLMIGLTKTTSSNASLLNNFEIVATAMIALFIFKETVSGKLWAAIIFVTVASVILSFDNSSDLKFSWGSLLILAADVCWGFENNCTRNISSKSVYEIVTIKGLCSGIGSLTIGFVIGEKMPSAGYIFIVMLLGFVAYGMSITFYIMAQKELGAAKTSAYYAIAPFAGAFLSFVVLKEHFTIKYFIALVFMIAGSILVTRDTLQMKPGNAYLHNVTHTSDTLHN